MRDSSDDIARINALTTNSRNTWFVLLGVLVFVGVTLMGVAHIDFYGVDRDTKLPLVDVEVPTRYFFIAAPILTTAIYGYFHLYLIRLWDALSDAEAQHDGRPLGDIISPWLVTDAALQLRRKLRKEDATCNAHRTMETPAMLLNIALAWLFGLLILLRIWWQSMPARDLLITGIAAACFLVSLTIGTASYVMLSRRMLRKRKGRPDLHRSIGFVTFLLFAAVVVLPLTWLRVSGDYDKNPNALATIAPLILVNEEIVDRPEGWLPHQIAHREFRADWCDREKMKECGDFGDRENEFQDEWQTRRQTTLASLRRPDWHKAENKPDFRSADLRGAFMPGIDLVQANLNAAALNNAEMEGADLRAAQMQGAILEKTSLAEGDFRGANMQRAVLFQAYMPSVNLQGAQLQGATLTGARMQGANLSSAQLQNAALNSAKMQQADLSGAKVQGASFRDAKMEGASLYVAQMSGADLIRAHMKGVFLRNAEMQETDLRSAQMEGVDLGGAQLEGANLSFAFLSGTPGDRVILEFTNLKAAMFHGGALRFVRFQDTEYSDETDLRNAFMDGSVDVPNDFAAQMGAPRPRPCQWLKIPAESDADFFALWRWWRETGPAWQLKFWNAPGDWQGVKSADAALRAKYGIPEDCKWKLGPMHGSDD